MSATYHFQTVKHVVHGPGSLDLLGEKLPLLDVPVRTVILVTQNAMHNLGVTQRVTDQLRDLNIRVHMLDNVEIEPTLENIERVFRDDVAPHAPDASRIRIFTTGCAIHIDVVR